MNLFKSTPMIRKKLKYDFTKRYFDNTTPSLRKIFLLLFLFAIFLYLIPYLKNLISFNNTVISDSLERCLDDQLTPYYYQSINFDVNINTNNKNLKTFSNLKLLPYIGNGYLALSIEKTSNIYIKLNDRSINFPINFYPFISLNDIDASKPNESATVVDFKNGIVKRLQCFPDYFITMEYYAHRTFPNILIQEIRITNKRNQIININLDLPKVIGDQLKNVKSFNLNQDNQFDQIQGVYEINGETKKYVGITLLVQKFSSNILLKSHGVTTIKNIISISYSQLVNQDQIQLAQQKNEKKSSDVLKQIFQISLDDGNNKIRKLHTKVWNHIWNTGFSISTSLAANTINGDQINATIYSVISQSRSYEFEDNIDPEIKSLALKSQNNVEGCYDSYHTLQTENLWRNLDTLKGINDLVSLWILTLEKQGCHNLVRAGVTGLIQAMVLSIGGFKFTNQHLEFNIHPKFLHRDFQFRRLKYDEMTNMNVTVSVMEDNKAIISVQINSTDKKFYACDAACLDEPVLVETTVKIFPVKLTEPLTAILYITDNKNHIDELHKAIHVKEVVEAPAHEHHVIALHKHGHHLGGLPAFFWLSISILVIVFHIFLCKLIIKEYCEPSDNKFRYRYNKA